MAVDVVAAELAVLHLAAEVAAAGEVAVDVGAVAAGEAVDVGAVVAGEEAIGAAMVGQPIMIMATMDHLV